MITKEINKPKRKTQLSCLGLIILLFLSACGRNELFTAFHSFPKETWDKDEVVVFKTDSLDGSMDKVQWSIPLRHSIEYPYRNLWLFVELTQDNGISKKDTLEVVFQLPDGTWLPQVKGSSAVKETTIHLPYYLQKPKGVYTLSIQHGMRDSLINGMLNLGVQLKQLE